MGFLFFIIGVVVGGIAFSALFLAEIYLSMRGGSFIKKAISKVESKAKPKAVIYSPPEEAEEAVAEIIERNNQEGKQTSAEEIGI